MKDNIILNHVIAGALSPGFEGYGGIILTTPSYIADIDEAKGIIRFDTEFDTYFNSYEGNYKDMLQISTPIILNDKLYRIFINARKKFTPFIGENRNYKRIEYFYVSRNNLYRTVQILKYLPVMEQWNKKNMGGLTPIPIVIDDSTPVSSNLTKAIFAGFLTQTPILIKRDETNTEDLRNKVLDALHPIPQIYQKYLGFGFNVKRTSSNFIEDKLHIYTTEDGGVALESLTVDNASKGFVEKVFAGSVNYDDTELQLLNTPISRDALYSLLVYHKLHYQVDVNEILTTEEQLKVELKKYVSDFAKSEFQNKKYIKKRISAIYKFWCKRHWLDAELFEWFKQLGFEIEKDAEIKKLEQNIFNNVNISILTQEAAFNFLQNNIKQLDEKKIKETIITIGLIYLLDKAESLLENVIVYNTLLGLLQSADLSTKLQWKNKYPKISTELSIDNELQKAADLPAFFALCNAFIDYSSVDYKDKVKMFVAKPFGFVGDNELAFYKALIRLAEKYEVKIKVNPVKAKGKSLFELYTLFDEKRVQIANLEILNEIGEDYIDFIFKETDFDTLDFIKTNKDFASKFQSKIITQLASKLNSVNHEGRYKIFISLLSAIIATGKNPFLQAQNELFDILKEIILDKKQISEISRLAKYIKKHENEDNIQFLLQQVEGWIGKNKSISEVQGENKSRLLSTMWIARIAAIILFAASLGINAYQYYHNSHEEIQSKVIASKPELLVSIKYFHDTINQLRSLVDSIALDPFPNDTLSTEDLGKLWPKMSDSTAIVLTIDSAVKIIFKKNPSDIKAFYENRPKYYAKLLVKKNPNCFIADSIRCDSIKYVPCYTQPKKNK